MESMYEGMGWFFFFLGCVVAYWGRAFVIKYKKEHSIYGILHPSRKEKKNNGN